MIVTSREHRLRFDAIESWLKHRGFLFGLEKGNLYDAWTIRQKAQQQTD